MAESTQSNSGGGCFSKLLFLILLVAAGGLGLAIFAAIEPQDLSDLRNPAPTAKAAPVRRTCPACSPIRKIRPL